MAPLVKVVPSEDEEDNNPRKHVETEPQVGEKNEVSTSTADPTMNESVSEPLPKMFPN